MQREIGRARALVLVMVAVAVTGCGRGRTIGSADSGAENTDSSRTADAKADVSGDVPGVNSDLRVDVMPDVSVDTVGVNPDGASDGGGEPPVDAVDVRFDAKPAADGRADASVDAVDVNPDVLVESTRDASVEVPMQPDGQSDVGTPLVPCSQDPSVAILDSAYVCGTCESELFFALSCIGGHLACPASYVGTNGTLVTVPAGQYVALRDDVLKKTGQCAYMAAYAYPGFALDDPGLLQTVRAQTQPLVLMAVSSSPQVQATFDWLVADRTKGESAIRSLVTLTDMTKNAPVAYTIGAPVRNSGTGVDSVALQPTSSLAANGWYRVTIFPGDTQQVVPMHTYNRTKLAWLTTPETTDFYTYSRPMVATLAIVSKAGSKGYLDFNFTEPLTIADLDAYPMAAIAVDGTALSGCLTPYACSGSSPAQTIDLRLDLDAVPTAFTEITLRLPLTARSTNGGTIRDGTVGNPHASIDGDWAVYTFEAVAMILTDSNLVRRWYYVGM